MSSPRRRPASGRARISCGPRFPHVTSYCDFADHRRPLGIPNLVSDPQHTDLVWDRLPMTMIFMAVTAIVLGLWLGSEWTNRVLWPLAAFGLASVVWWSMTDDLRPYALAQFGPALLLLPTTWKVPQVRGLWLAFLLYVLAKVAESFDDAIYGAVPLSGHTLKHFLAAAATYCIYRWRSTFFAMDRPSLSPPPSATPIGT